MQYFHVRLSEVGSDDLSWPLLWVLVQQLPRDSRVAVTLSGPAWGIRDHLLAGVFDQLAVANWQRTKDAENGINQPVPLPRPGSERRPVRTVADLREWMGRVKRGELKVVDREARIAG